MNNTISNNIVLILYITVANKTARYTGILNKLKTYVPTNILKTINNSLYYFISHNYGILAWEFSITCLFKLQK